MTRIYTPLLESNPNDPRHGTENGYRHRGCHCLRCRLANADACAKYRLARRLAPIPEHVHGTVNGYTNYCCHCDRCIHANTSANARRKGTSVRHWPVPAKGRTAPVCHVNAHTENLNFAETRDAVTCRRCTSHLEARA